MLATSIAQLNISSLGFQVTFDMFKLLYIECYLTFKCRNIDRIIKQNTLEMSSVSVCHCSEPPSVTQTPWGPEAISTVLPRAQALTKGPKASWAQTHYVLCASCLGTQLRRELALPSKGG